MTRPQKTYISIQDTKAFPVPGADGYYINERGEVFSSRVSGPIRSEFSKRPDLVRANKLLLLSQCLDPGGYYRVGIRYNNNTKFKNTLVHHLVALTFLGPRPAELVINHINHIRTDNRPENLEYVSLAENIRKTSSAGKARNIAAVKAYHADLDNKAKLVYRLSGERSARHKFSDSQIAFIRELKKKHPTATQLEISHMSAAEGIQISRRHVSEILNNKQRKESK